MLTRQRFIGGLLGAVSSLALVGCAADVGATDDEVDDTFFDGKADRAGLFEHQSHLEDNAELGIAFDRAKRAHAFPFEIGTDEHVTFETSLFSGDSGPEVDTVLYLYQQDENGNFGHYLRKNNNTRGTKWSRIEMDLEPGTYRVIISAATSSVRGNFAINTNCADGFCNQYAPPTTEPEEDGVGEPDAPGHGNVSFVVPLENDDGVLLSSFNDELRAAGLETFPDTVTVSSTSNNPASRFEMFNQRAATEEVLAITGSEMVQYSDPGQFLANGFCYRGDGFALADFTSGFSDNIFSDMYSVYGWRAGTRSAYLEWKEPSESNDDYADFSDFDTESDDVMLMYSTDDDGTAQFVTVPRCN